MVQAFAQDCRAVKGGEVMKTWILFLYWLLVIMFIFNIINKAYESEVKESLELVKKANALCKETK